MLVDCGISYRQLVQRMEALGIDPGQIEAVLLTHEHDDHVKGLEVFLRRHPVPVLATAGTVEGDDGPAAARRGAGLRARGAARRAHGAAGADEPRRPRAGGLRAGERRARGSASSPTPAWSRELLVERLSGCHALLLECNHDRDMLRVGPYPWPLKQRIASRTGHLSNEQSCGALERLAHSGLEVVVGMHLSQTNNRPDLVERELARRPGGVGRAARGRLAALRRSWSSDGPEPSAGTAPS